jgi:hypothetical protein
VPPVLIGAFLVFHGLITTMIGVGSVARPNGPAMPMPAWLDWWPGPFGRSWVVDGFGLGTAGAVAAGLVWLASGVVLVAAGAGYLGLGPFRDLWPALTVAGGGLGLLAVGLSFHPFYLAALVINLVVVILAWGRSATGVAPA